MKTLANSSTLRIAHKTIACLLVFCMVNLPVWALDAGDATIVTGAVANNGVPANTVSFDILGKGIIEWSHMKVYSSDTLQFTNKTASAGPAVLNRVARQIQFDGTLDAPGINVIMVGPGGIIGSTAQITASAFTLSGLNLSNQNFLNGVYQYEPFNGVTVGETPIQDGVYDVSDYGDIKGVSDQVALLGKTVLVNGHIYMDGGTVILAAGDSILLTEQNSNIAVQVNVPTTPPIDDDYNVEYKCGIIGAKDVTFAAAGDIWSSAVVSAYDKGSSASVTMDAGGNVDITDPVTATADATEGGDAAAAITINAGGNVKVTDDSYYGNETNVTARANNGVMNTATTDINAGGNVLVQGENGGKAEVEAIAKGGETNNASANVVAGGDVEVKALCEQHASEAEIMALAKNGVTNNADVDIAAGGNVVVLGQDGGQAQIESIAKNAYAEDAEASNTANINIATENGDVLTQAIGGLDCDSFQPSEALIGATAENEEFSDSSNNANVLICVNGGVKVNAENGANAEIEALAANGSSNTATVGIGAKGEDGVSVAAENNGEASIGTTAQDGDTNTANTIVCTQGGVGVIAENHGDAAITAQAKDGAVTDASVGVCAAGDVEVRAGNFEVGCDATIASEAEGNGESDSATANTAVRSREGSVSVLAFNDGDADISSGAYGAANVDAYTGVRANQNIVVGAAYGGEAMVQSEAKGSMLKQADATAQQGIERPENPTTANAETVAYTQNGYVLAADVAAEQPRSAGITSEAGGADLNTAYTGVAAGAEMTAPVGPASTSAPLFTQLLGDFDEQAQTGSVYVLGQGDYTDARIMSETYGGYENTSNTVISAPGETVVWGDDYRSKVKIKSLADYGLLSNTATTQVYSSEVHVDVDTLRFGNGIGAYGDGGWVNIDNSTAGAGYGSGYPSGDGWDWFADSDNSILFTGDGDGSTLIIGSYANRQDTPDAPTCPDCPCEKQPVTYPAAPLPLVQQPQLKGCPAEMDAAAVELGINTDELQLRIADAMATNPNLQPCDACRTLLTSASALKDPDGSRMAALSQIFNSLAPADAPFTPEVSASVATAFADMANQDPQYALAAQYVDAFANYVAVVENDLKSPVGDPVALVMEKYGQQLADSNNPNIAAYIMAQMTGKSL